MFTMRFDMRAPGCSASERGARYRTALDMATYADGRGCASIIVSEHHGVDDGYLPAPMVMAAALAAVTSSVPIVVAAALLPLHDPVRLAEEMVVVDHLSAGRAMFVLALGYRREEYELFGVEYRDRGRVADEKLAAVLDALDRARTGRGPHVTPAPFSPGGPLLAWGGGTPAAARRAGRFGVGFFAQTDRPGLKEAYESAAASAGHQPGLCVLPSPEAPMSIFVNDDLDAGWDDVGDALLVDAVSYYDWNEAAGSAGYTASLSSARTVAELRAGRGSHRVVTTPEAADLIGRHGMLALQPLCGGLDPDVAWPYLRRVVDDVLPAVAGSR